jgi:hypothetical protein
MKKLFVAAALVMSLGTSVVLADNVKCNKTESVCVADEFVVIELKDVPQAVQDAVAKNYEGSSIKEAHAKTAEDGKKTYKLILVDGNQAESIILFNDKGEEVKQAE